MILATSCKLSTNWERILLSHATSDVTICWMTLVTLSCVFSTLATCSKLQFEFVEDYRLWFVERLCLLPYSWTWDASPQKTLLSGYCGTLEIFWIEKYSRKETLIGSILHIIYAKLQYLQLLGNSFWIRIPIVLLRY